MAQIKLSLRQSLLAYVLVCALLALLFSLLTAAACDQAAENIRAAYPPVGEKYYLTNAQGEQLGEGAYIGAEPVAFSASDERRLAALELLRLACAPVYAVLAIGAAVWLFYRNRLKKPLRELLLAAEKIAADDLDFAVNYASPDELGQLCQSFERMRARLAANLAEMWRLAEERRRLNAAFAHDLRTPLTVLKGYNEILQLSPDKTTIATAATMSRHIARLENYTAGMSHLQRLEELQPSCRRLSLEVLHEQLAESAQIICARQGKEFRLDCQPAAEVCVDTEFVSRAANNLLENAARYARRQVSLNLQAQASGLLLTVDDDGPGFAPDGLRQAAEPYFSGEADRAAHFGLGLYICRLLCQQHGGYLQLGNRDEGGGAKVLAYFADLQ